MRALNTADFHGLGEADVLAVSNRGDGSDRVLRLRGEDRSIVVKCYGLRTTRLKSFMRELGSRTFVGKSSIRALARRETEREVLELWHREGFDVPRVLSIEPPGGIDVPCLVMEWVPGRSLSDILRCGGTSIEEKKTVIGRFAASLGRRHTRALAHRDPRLVHQHPSFDHVLLSGDRLVHLDFEVVFTRSGKIERLVRREIAGFLWAIYKAGRGEIGALLDAFVEAYPDPTRLLDVLEDLRRYGCVPFSPLTTLFQRFGRRGKRTRRRFPMIAAFEQAMCPGGPRLEGGHRAPGPERRSPERDGQRRHR